MNEGSEWMQASNLFDTWMPRARVHKLNDLCPHVGMSIEHAIMSPLIRIYAAIDFGPRLNSIVDAESRSC